MNWEVMVLCLKYIFCLANSENLNFKHKRPNKRKLQEMIDRIKGLMLFLIKIKTSKVFKDQPIFHQRFVCICTINKHLLIDMEASLVRQTGESTYFFQLLVDRPFFCTTRQIWPSFWPFDPFVLSFF